MNIPDLVTVDVNVAITANGGASHAPAQCQKACVEMLLGIVKGSRIALDNTHLIFREYLNHLSLAGQPGTGDLFFRWVHDYQWNSESCERVAINASNERGFAEFPGDPALGDFDPADRKYVAVAAVSGATIVNATDSDWRIFDAPFAANGITVISLCV